MRPQLALRRLSSLTLRSQGLVPRSYSTEVENKPAQSQYQRQRQRPGQQGRNPNQNQNQNQNHNQSQAQNKRKSFQKKTEPPAIFTRRQAYERELAVFRELLVLSNQRTKGSSDSLMDLSQAMDLYKRLREVQLFLPSDIAHLIQSIHASSRIHGRYNADEISRDRNWRARELSGTLLEYLELLVSDIRQGVSSVTQYGLMHLVTCYSTIKRPERGLEVWREIAAIEPASAVLPRLAWTPKVVGAAIDLMIAEAVPMEEIEAVYKQSQQRLRAGGAAESAESLGGSTEGASKDSEIVSTPSFAGVNSKAAEELFDNLSSINLEHALIRAYIFHDHNAEALQLFSEVLKLHINEHYHLARIHETFVGDCADLAIATTFFEEAAQHMTPYEIVCHPSAVHRLMERISAQTNDLEAVKHIYTLYLKSVPESRPEQSFNILTYSMLTAFFKVYPTYSDEAYAQLQTIISSYADLRPRVSHLFLNSLLTLVSNSWHNAQVTLEIIDAYAKYEIPSRVDSIRVILNAFQRLDADHLSLDRINEVWLQRLALGDLVRGVARNERGPLQAFDFYALARACCEVPDRHQLFAEKWLDYAQQNDVSMLVESIRKFSASDARYAFVLDIVR